MPLQASFDLRSARSGYPCFPRCPRCNDVLFAAESSEFVADRVVRHHWACDACGHQFRETVKVVGGFQRRRIPLAKTA